MKKIVTLLSFALLLNASTLSASSITLNEAIDILKTQNLEIKAANLEVSSARADADTVSGNECTIVCPQGISSKTDIEKLRSKSAMAGYSDPSFANSFGGGFGFDGSPSF